MSTSVTKLAKAWGLSITDARDPVTVVIKKEDTKGATCKDPEDCVIARALKRQMAAEWCAIFRSTATVRFAGVGKRKARLVRYLLPKDTRDAIEAFDSTKRFKPGKYRFDAPTKSQTLGACRERTAKRPGRHETGSGEIRRKVVHATSTARINTLRLTHA